MRPFPSKATLPIPPKEEYFKGRSRPSEKKKKKKKKEMFQLAPPSPRFCSLMFIVQKYFGAWRQIMRPVDSEQVHTDEQIPYEDHTVSSASIQQNDWMFSTDLKDN